MKILILNSSPRKNGNISKMLETMKQEIECCNAEAVYVRVPELKVRPCIGCMKCRSSLRCCLPEDDAQRVLQSIRDADALIIGAPCYWGNIVKALKEILKWSGFKVVKAIEKGGTRKHPDLTSKEISHCKRAVHKLL